MPAGTEDQLKTFVQSFLSDLLPQSGQQGTNPLLSAPPNSASLLHEAAGGLNAVTPSEVPPTESPGEVLLLTQEDRPPPEFNVHDVSLDSGVASSWGGGSLFPGLVRSVRSDGMDHLRVGGSIVDSSNPVMSALSPTTFLFPVSVSGFVSLPSSYSSSSFSASRPSSASLHSSLPSTLSSSSAFSSLYSFPSPAALSSSLSLLLPPRPSVLPTH